LNFIFMKTKYLITAFIIGFVLVITGSFLKIQKAGIVSNILLVTGLLLEIVSIVLLIVYYYKSKSKV